MRRLFKSPFHLRSGFVVCLLLALFIPAPERSTAATGAAASESGGTLPGKILQIGQASFMADEIHGHMTANGELYDMRQLSAAHRTLPFHTLVEVRNLLNNKTVRVRINDRGPYAKGRIIDLSFAAAQVLGLVEAGSGLVELRILSEK
jgi:rare lipoprotein A